MVGSARAPVQCEGQGGSGSSHPCTDAFCAWLEHHCTPRILLDGSGQRSLSGQIAGMGRRRAVASRRDRAPKEGAVERGADNLPPRSAVTPVDTCYGGKNAVAGLWACHVHLPPQGRPPPTQHRHTMHARISGQPCTLSLFPATCRCTRAGLQARCTRGLCLAGGLRHSWCELRMRSSRVWSHGSWRS